MANIVDLREMGDEKLAEMLEGLHEEMFNFRFQRASGQLENYTQLKRARRERAQVLTVLNTRKLAAKVATGEPSIAKALVGKTWQATSAFDYEQGAWLVRFVDESNKELASAKVNLNKAHPHGRTRRNRKPSNRVLAYTIA